MKNKTIKEEIEKILKPLVSEYQPQIMDHFVKQITTLFQQSIDTAIRKGQVDVLQRLLQDI